MNREYKKREEKYLSLNAKITIAKIVIKDALDTFIRPAVVWSAILLVDMPLEYIDTIRSSIPIDLL